MKVITQCLAEPELSQTEHLPLLQQLLLAVTTATVASGDSCSEHSLKLFTVLLRLSASSHVEQLREEVMETIGNIQLVVYIVLKAPTSAFNQC